jgi:signal transduction histidine kinase
MSETNSSTGDSAGASQSETVPRWRLAAFGVVFLIAVLLVAGIEVTTWRQMGRLKEDFAGANLESFYLGTRLREGIERMNGMLFRYQLSEDAATRESFNEESRALSEKIGQTRNQLRTRDERELVQQIEMAYERYLADTSELLQRGRRGIRRDTAVEVQQQISEKSMALVALADKLVQAQHVALTRFFDASERSAGSVQWLLVASVLMLLLLIGSIAALMHRALVAPLRARLNESQTVIERQEKLASLGVLAAGVAHEIRNPLTAIKFRLFSLKKSLPAELENNEDAVVINNEINRLERIVKDFLQFARPSEPEFTLFPAADLLQTVGGLLSAELEKRAIELKTEPFDGLILRADKQQMQQVLINLVQNAADSIERHGVITLRARQGATSVFKQSQPMVVLEVSDSGRGIPSDVEKRIFDPFFSTKEGGTGLGLAIAARIVEKHGGFIQYSTQLDRGTTFSIVMPKASSDESSNPPD